jgi:hypothetical protein
MKACKADGRRAAMTNYGGCRAALHYEAADADADAIGICRCADRPEPVAGSIR